LTGLSSHLLIASRDCTCFLAERCLQRHQLETKHRTQLAAVEDFCWYNYSVDFGITWLRDHALVLIRNSQIVEGQQHQNTGVVDPPSFLINQLHINCICILVNRQLLCWRRLVPSRCPSYTLENMNLKLLAPKAEKPDDDLRPVVNNLLIFI
jgi:hypothetical protein